MDAALQDLENSWSRQSAWGQMAATRIKGMAERLSAQIREDDTAIDFGGNDGLCAQVWEMLTHAPMTVCDITENRLAEARRHGLTTLKADLHDLPLADQSIDWGFCSHTLEHVDSLSGVLKEIRRVIKRAVMFVIPLEDDNMVRKSPAHLRHNPDPEWWAQRLRGHDFIVKWWQDSLNPHDAIFLAMTPEWFKEIQSEPMNERETLVHHTALERRIMRLAERGLEKGSWADFGSFDGHIKALMREYLDVTPTTHDFGSADIVCHLDKIPVPDKAYDYGFCSHTLEHVVHLGDTLRELKRVCKRGICVIVPLQSRIHGSWFIRHYTANDDPYWWQDQFIAAGFRVEAADVHPYLKNMNYDDLYELECWLVPEEGR